MKRLLISIFVTLIAYNYAMSMNMSVGDTKSLSIGSIPHLQGCQWTISHPNNIVFVVQPHSLSTEVEIKAIKIINTTAPCVVSCKYYYLELDPTTGRYIYSRTGYKDWNIFVRDNGDNNDNDDPSNNTISLDTYSTSVKVDEWVKITANTSSSKYTWSIDNPGYANATSTVNNILNVRGVCPGETYVRVNSNNGGYASCKITVYPKSEYSLDERIEAPTVEGVSMSFSITSVENKTCSATGIPSRTTGKVTIPLEAHGFLVTEISNSAGFKKTDITEISFPVSLKRIGNYAFQECNSLTSIVVPEGVTSLGMGAFSGCASLKELELPSTLEEIDFGAFGGWGTQNNFTKIKSHITSPFEIDSRVFTTNAYKYATLYVPLNTKVLYENTNGWNKFERIVEYTDFSNISNTRISHGKEYINIYGIDGKLKHFGDRNENILSKGIYIINDKKILVK